MKILLDESAPQKLRLLITACHQTFTAGYLGWSGMKNGALLAAAEEAGFDLMITADHEIEYQQNFGGRRLAILVLSTNNWGAVKQRVELIAAAIEAVVPGTFTYVDIGQGRGT